MTDHEYPQCMFCSQRKKKRYTPVPKFHFIKVGYKWVYITRTCYHDGSDGRAELDLSHMCLVRRLNPH